MYRLRGHHRRPAGSNYEALGEKLIVPDERLMVFRPSVRLQRLARVEKCWWTFAESEPVPVNDSVCVVS